MNYFVVADPIKCIGCRTCMIACVVEHNGEDIFYQNPEEINFNPKLEVVKNAQVSAPIQCRQCVRILNSRFAIPLDGFDDGFHAIHSFADFA